MQVVGRQAGRVGRDNFKAVRKVWRAVWDLHARRGSVRRIFMPGKAVYVSSVLRNLRPPSSALICTVYTVHNARRSATDTLHGTKKRNVGNESVQWGNETSCFARALHSRSFLYFSLSISRARPLSLFPFFPFFPSSTLT